MVAEERKRWRKGDRERRENKARLRSEWVGPETALATNAGTSTVGLMIRGIDHLNIVVTDLARSLRFYCDVLGFTQTHEARLEGEWIERIVGLRGVKARAVFIVAPTGEPRIELLCYEAPRGQAPVENSRANTVGLRHLAFRVDDMAATVAQLRAAGVTLFSDPVRVPGGVVKFAAGDKTLVYFLDPDGVLLELAEYA